MNNKKSLALSAVFLSAISAIMWLSTPLPIQNTPVNSPQTPISVTTTVEDTTEEIPVTSNNPSSRIVATQSAPSPEILVSDNKIQELMKSPYVQEKLSENTIVSDSSDSYPLRTYTTQALPNDPAANQWWTTNTKLPELWDQTTGSADTVLAIIDTGFALQHEEFQGRWHENSAEKGIGFSEQPSKLNCSDRSLALNLSCNLIDDDFDGIVDNESGPTTVENPSQLNCTDQGRPLDKSCNMIDDDGNGLIDDWRGWDFMNFDNSVQAGDINPSGNGVRHGSYVTGIAAANANNNVGIAGVNWRTRILPIQALSDDGSGTSISVARSIRYAVARGANVISLSLGGTYPDSYIRQAVQEAITAGVIVVAATGNDGCECVSYPANYPEVVAVGALNQNNERASFSSYGENVDIVAPGTQLYTASWSQNNQTSAYASGIAGTSLATPIVSGLLAILVGEYPELSSNEIIAIITENTNRLSIPTVTTHSAFLGYGGIDTVRSFSRPLLAQSPSMRYGLSFSDTPRLHACEENYFGSSRLYRLSKNAIVQFSADPIEIYQKQQQGYSAQLFTYACRSLAVDKPETVRLLQLYSEFSVFKKF